MRGDDPTSIVSTLRVQAAVRAMLDKRGVPGDDDEYDPMSGDEPISRLWSFRRGTIAVVAVVTVKKGNAEALLEAIEADEGIDRLVLIYTDKCTPMAGDLLRDTEWVERWSDEEVCIHPFRFGFIKDAGIVDGPDHMHAHLLEGKDRTKLPKSQYHVDPVRRYLGAKLGDVTWTLLMMGLEPEIKLRYVDDRPY